MFYDTDGPTLLRFNEDEPEAVIEAAIEGPHKKEALASLQVCISLACYNGDYDELRKYMAALQKVERNRLSPDLENIFESLLCLLDWFSAGVLRRRPRATVASLAIRTPLESEILDYLFDEGFASYQELEEHIDASEEDFEEAVEALRTGDEKRAPLIVPEDGRFFLTGLGRSAAYKHPKTPCPRCGTETRNL